MNKEEVRQILVDAGGVYCEDNYVTKDWVDTYCGCCNYALSGVDEAMTELEDMCSGDWSLVTLV